VVAQPRRIAATGVASRVAEERGEISPGQDSVGYVVRGDSAICDRTRILFCTTGVLLRQLQNEAALDCITHIVVDEVNKLGVDSKYFVICYEMISFSYHVYIYPFHLGS
jgi:ATP-dependent RNA helicase DHX57